MRPLCRATLNLIEALRRFAHVAGCNNRGALMLDILTAMLGTGGILLMAGYAALCERI